MTSSKHLHQSAAIVATFCSCIELSSSVLAQGTTPVGWSTVLPISQTSFGGAIERNSSESTPDYPKSVTAPAGAANASIKRTDETGFGAASTRGGPIPTPTTNWLAKTGLQYNQ